MCTQSVCEKSVGVKGKGVGWRGVPSSRWRELRPTFWPKVIYAAFSRCVEGRKGGWRATAENENKSRCTAIRFLKKKRSFAIPFLLLAKGWKFSVEIGVCTHEAKTLFPLSGSQTSLAFSVFPVLALWIVHSMQMKSWFRSKAPSMEIYLWIPRVYWYLRPSGEIYLFWNLDSPSFIYKRAFLL